MTPGSRKILLSMARTTPDTQSIHALHNTSLRVYTCSPGTFVGTPRDHGAKSYGTRYRHLVYHGILHWYQVDKTCSFCKAYASPSSPIRQKNGAAKWSCIRRTSTAGVCSAFLNMCDLCTRYHAGVVHPTQPESTGGKNQYVK